MSLILTSLLCIFGSLFNPPIPNPSTNRPSDFILPHSFYGYLIGSLLALVEIKYEGSSSNPFKEHSVIMMLFLGTQFAYVIILMTFKFNPINDHSLNLKFVVCHILGTLSCQLLILVLVSPTEWLIINVSPLVLVGATSFCYKYLLRLLNSAETQSSEIHNEEEGQANEMVEVQMLDEIRERCIHNKEGQAPEMAEVQMEAEIPSFA